MPRFNTDQEVFDEVAHHLLTQNEQAQDANGHCMYRDEENGYACAIGCCIPEELYSSNMEEKNVGELLSEHYDVMDQIFGREVDIYLLKKLQHVHDDVSICFWHNTLVTIADDFELSKDALKDLS